MLFGYVLSGLYSDRSAADYNGASLFELSDHIRSAVENIKGHIYVFSVNSLNIRNKSLASEGFHNKIGFELAYKFSVDLCAVSNVYAEIFQLIFFIFNEFHKILLMRRKSRGVEHSSKGVFLRAEYGLISSLGRFFRRFKPGGAGSDNKDYFCGNYLSVSFFLSFVSNLRIISAYNGSSLEYGFDTFVAALTAVIRDPGKHFFGKMRIGEESPCRSNKVRHAVFKYMLHGLNIVYPVAGYYRNIYNSLY